MNGQAEVIKATAAQLIQMVGGHEQTNHRAGLIEKLSAIKLLFRLPKWKIRKPEKTQTAELRQAPSSAGTDVDLDEF
jgi:hypothetical protein